MKKCRSCGIEKEGFEFYAKPINSDGLYSYCKACVAEKNRNSRIKNYDSRIVKESEYREKNREFLREKSLEYYYKNRGEILYKSSKYRRENREKISIRESLRRFSDADRFEKNRKKHKSWSDKNRESLNRYQRVWYQNNKEKRRAHVILHRALKKGEVIRPLRCAQCNVECMPDGHHEDYGSPLDVIWLCSVCHARKSRRTVKNVSCQ